MFEGSVNEIKAEWRRLVKSVHPDHGGNAEDFIALRQAYEKALIKAIERPCSKCKGRCKVWEGSGFARIQVTCKTCKGTGRYQ